MLRCAPLLLLAACALPEPSPELTVEWTHVGPDDQPHRRCGDTAVAVYRVVEELRAGRHVVRLVEREVRAGGITPPNAVTINGEPIDEILAGCAGADDRASS